MSTLKAVTHGKEHVIVLPSENWDMPLPNTPPKVVPKTGMHAVVVSGYAVYEHDDQPLPDGFPDPIPPPLPFGGPGDDDTVFGHVVEVTVGPEWRNVYQVSPSVTLNGIKSGDSDDVDHSRWVVRSCVWDTKQTLAGERILLRFNVEVQGFRNLMVNYAYQLVATGDLWNLPDFHEISGRWP